MATDLRDDILKLAKGKATKSKIGSRKVPHRLKKFEWKRLEIALKNGVLKKKIGDRDALENVFIELMEAENRKAIIVNSKFL